MVSSLSFSSAQIANIYKTSQSALSDSLIKLSSGKNYLQPKDGVAEYFIIDSLNRDRRGYEDVRRNLAQSVSMVSTAEDLGMQLVESFKQLKILTSDWWEAEAGSSDRDHIENEFNAVVSSMQTMMDSAVFNGKDLMQAGTLTSIILNPNDISQTFDITFANGDIVDTTGLAVGAGADYQATIDVIDAESNKALSYLSKTSGYLNSLYAQMNVTDSMIENQSAVESSINDINDAAEIKEMITQEIRQQASVAMMAQASMIQMSVLKLVNF